MPYSSPEKRRAYRATEAVRQRERERDRRDKQTPEYRAKRRARRLERLATDPTYRARERSWRPPTTPRELFTAKSANRTAKKYGIPGRLTVNDVFDLWMRQPVCLSCGEGQGLDHIVPMGKGGPNTPDNIQNLCYECNQRKSSWLVPPEQIRRAPFRTTSTHCREGHPRESNTYINPGSGKRQCRPCHAASVLRYRSRKAAA